MSDLESLALLIADLNAQVRSLQAENTELREALELGAQLSSPGPTPVTA